MFCQGTDDSARADRMMKVFVSYSRFQGDWVRKSLVPVLRAGGADVLIDWECFKAGATLIGQMDKIQDQADIQLICVSAEYLASDYCWHELRRAISLDPGFTKQLEGRIKHGFVVPIRLDGASWPTDILTPNPLIADLHDAAKAALSWKLVLDQCQADLGTTAQSWLKARANVERVLKRGQVL